MAFEEKDFGLQVNEVSMQNFVSWAANTRFDDIACLFGPPQTDILDFDSLYYTSDNSILESVLAFNLE